MQASALVPTDDGPLLVFPRSCHSPSLKLNAQTVLDAPQILLGQYTPGADNDNFRAMVNSMIRDTQKTSLLRFSSCPKRMDPNHPWLQPVPEDARDSWVEVDRMVSGDPTKGNCAATSAQLEELPAEESKESPTTLRHLEPPSSNSCGMHYLGERVVILVVVAGVKMMMPPDFKDTLRHCKTLIVAQYNHKERSQADIMREYWDKNNAMPFTVFYM